MRKAFLLFLITIGIGLQAQAQFWKRAQPVRLALIEPARTNTIDLVKLNPIKFVNLEEPTVLGRSRYSQDIEEAAIMKDLYHTLRFRMYPEAINSFNRLISVYIEESRYSEAKWYLLQIIYFGKKSNNNFAVVNGMISLGLLKADIGEYDQAKQDLLDAKSICFSQNMASQVSEIDKKLKVVEAKRFANVKNDVQYAEVFEDKKG